MDPDAVEVIITDAVYLRWGDEFAVNGKFSFEKFGGGAKKLKEYFIDKKIPERERDKILLLAKDKKVFIICGIEISDAIKVDKATKNVLQCSIYDNRH